MQKMVIKYYSRKYFDYFWSNQLFQFEGARRDSDIRPKLPDDLPPRKKAYYMDEALTKTSK